MLIQLPQTMINAQRGAASFMTTIMLLLSMGAVTAYSVRSAVMSQRAAINDYQYRQAFEAADAGQERGLIHFNNNTGLVLVDGDGDGAIDKYSNSAISNVKLPNSANYNVTYHSPQANNMALVEVRSIGSSSDGRKAVTTIQLINLRSLFEIEPPAGVITRSSVDLSGNLTIQNTNTDFTVWSGGNVSFSGSASTQTSKGKGSSKNGIGADVKQNDPVLGGLTEGEFFEYFFNLPEQTVKENAHIVYQNNIDTNYSDNLNGKLGKVIWIDQVAGQAKVNSNIVIGSPEQPVVVIVDGDLHVNAKVTVHGVVYVANDWNNSGGGTLNVYGGMLVNGKLSGTGTPDVVFDSVILGKVQSQLGLWAKVPGSWRDI